MAQITVTVPDGTPPRIVDALAASYDYDRRAGPGETKAAFAERMVRRWLRGVVLTAEARAAAAAAATDPTDPLNGP